MKSEGSSVRKLATGVRYAAAHFGTGEPGQGGKSPDNNRKPDEDAIPPLAQIKILRHMQADLNERTAAFAKRHPDPAKWTVAQKSAIDRLRRAQVELADLFVEVAPEAPPAGEKP